MSSLILALARTPALGGSPNHLALVGFSCVLMVGAFGAFSGCGGAETTTTEVQEIEPPVALFAFSDGTLPWPNDLASRPEYEDSFGTPPEHMPAWAEYLATYADHLPGATTQPLVRFLVDRSPEELAVETFQHAVQLLEIRGGPEGTLEMHPGPDLNMDFEEWVGPSGEKWTRFSAVPSTRLLQNTSYLAILRTTATSADGHPVTPAPAFTRVLYGDEEPEPAQEQTVPMDEADQAFVDAASAELSPLLQWLEDHGVKGEPLPKNKIALAWPFTVHNLPVATCDPRAPSTPTPNALRRNAQGQLKAAYRESPISPADEAYLEWLYSLDGPLVRVQARLSFSMALPEEFIAATHAQVFALDDGWDQPESWSPFTVSAAASTSNPAIMMEPRGDPARGHRGFNPGTEYLAVVYAPLSDHLIAPSEAVAALRSTYPLVVDGRSQLPHLTDLEAASLESHRQDVQVLFQGLEHHHIPRNEVVALWTWRTRSSAELIFDSQTLGVPFPGDHLVRWEASEERAASGHEEDKGAFPDLHDTFIERQGFAITTPVHVAFTLPIDADSLDVADDHQDLSNMSKAGFLVFDVTEVKSPSHFSKNLCPGKTDACAPPSPIQARVAQPGLIALETKDGLALPPGKRLLFVATHKLRPASDEAKIGIDPRFFLRTLEHPLFDPDTQESLVKALSHKDAAELEAQRLETNLWMGFINVATQGVVQAEDVLALWTLRTSDPSEAMGAAMAWVREDPELNTPLNSFKISSAQALESVLQSTPFEHLAGGVIDGIYLSRARGDLPPETGDEPRAQGASDLSDWSVVERNFVMSIPNQFPPLGGWPVVLYQHDLAGDRFDLFTFADTYAQVGRVGIATDAFPEVFEDSLDRERLLCATNEKSTPASLLQSLVHVGALLRFIRETLPNQIAVNPQEIYLHAESGGGIIATPLLAFDPNIRGGLFSFFGGNLARIAEENTLLNSWADLQECWPWLHAPATDTGIPLARYLGLWALEPVEPMVYAPRILAGTDNTPLDRRILLQMIRPDPIIPTLSSLEFWKAMGGPEHPDTAQLIEYDHLCRSFLRSDCQSSPSPPDIAAVDALRAQALNDIQNFLEGTAP